MARQLDPELQRIIDNVSHGIQSSDKPPRFSIQPDTFAHAALNRHPSYHETKDERVFSDGGFQSARTMLDRSMLGSFDESRNLNSNSGFLRSSLSSVTGYKHSIAAESSPSSIYGRQISQQQPANEEPYMQALQTTAAMNRSQHVSTLREPTAFFHGIYDTDLAHIERQPSTTPFNLSSYAYNTPAKANKTPPSQREDSSPSNRISLRRMSNRPSAQTAKLPRMSRSDFEDEPALTKTPSRQDIVDTRGSNARTKFPQNPPTVQGIRLISPHELSDRFRHVFQYELFNAVQSKCFAPIFYTTDNIVVAAPTGSGKTVILELAICKLVEDFGSDQFKIVYQAPTKSLCSERARDWQKKFSHLDLNCAELTGDTDSAEMRKVGNAAIIVTTPEKWDSITRKWKDHTKLLQMVKLVLIDEVHILNDPRGATLEAVVSRMRSIGASIRFVALSATVPNSEDIAAWLGKNHTDGHLPAHRETFGEEFRPVKLQKHVYGFSANNNDFAFDKILDTKLPGLILKHTIRKPMIVFCVTRKICETTAAKLVEWWSSLRVADRPWPLPTQKTTVGNPELRELVQYGVAFHHAGLDLQDRITVEAGFIGDGLSVICCTSTLAVGVNLPCHLVVIKNTVGYKDTGLSEYSDLDVMQMLGRAGRPQFDDTATAIIMTRPEKVDHYKLMISGQDILESTLHLNLIEHLNSEICLGTIHDVYSAKRWLSSTFLSVRMRKNPTYYKFSCDTGSRDVDERLERICERDVELLKSTKLITEEHRFSCTEYGLAMSKYMVQYETMKLLLNIPKNAKMTQILHTISQSIEFKDIRMRPNERAAFRELNKSPFIKSPIRENISTFAHKVSLIIQTYLGGVELPMNKEFNIMKRQFQIDKVIIFERVLRLIRCVIECKSYDCDAISTCSALELLRSASAGFWENSTLQLRQIPGIGPAMAIKLVQSDIKTVVQLNAMDSAAIERVMSRNPPFGKKILDIVANFPRLTLQADITKKIVKIGEPVRIQVKVRIGYANVKFPIWNRKTPAATFVAFLSSGLLSHIWRGSLKRIEKGFDIAFTCELGSHSDIVICQFACEEVIGTIQSVELRPEISATNFPPPKPIFPPAGPESEPSGIEVDCSVKSADLAAPLVDIIEDDRHNASGSDYGGGSIFNDFVDIDDLGKGSVEENGEPEVGFSEPVRMENGKWRCNHKCRDAKGNYLSKNGLPCRHLCCREGVDKPRKIQKKKKMDSDTVVEISKGKKGNSKTSKQTSRDMSKLMFNSNESGLFFQDVEEIDLTAENLEVESAYNSPRQYPPTPGVLSLEGKPGSVRISKVRPRFSYASGSQPDLSLIGRSNLNDRNSPDFPSPSALLDNDNSFEYDLERDSETVVSMTCNGKSRETAPMNSTNSITESYENTVFEFNAPDTPKNGSQEQALTPGTKRPASPPTTQPAVKFRRMVLNEETSKDTEPSTLHIEEVMADTVPRKPLPAWIAEADQDLLAFFGDSVQYVE